MAAEPDPACRAHNSDSPLLFLPKLKARLSPFLQKGATFWTSPFQKTHLNKGVTKKAFLDVFQHLCFIRIGNFMSIYMVYVTAQEYVTQVTENIGLTGPPGTCLSHLPCWAPLRTSQCLTSTDTLTNFPCDFLKQGLGKLSVGRKCRTANKDGAGLWFSSRRCRGSARHGHLPCVFTCIPAVV